MKILSILIPVYKTEKYIGRCLDSILMNKDGNENLFEIIIADDGSPDRSGTICDEYSKRLPDTIFVYHKKNEGTGATRNFLLDKARGKYIWFVDSDDTITDNALNDILSMIENHNGVDIISFCLRRFNVEGEYQSVENVPTHLGEMSGKDYFITKEVDGFMCNKIYRYNFLNENHIRFNSNMICLEDSVFNLYSFVACKRILITDVLVYNYFQGNPTSTLKNNSKKASEKKIKDSLLAEQEIKRLYNNVEDKVVKDALKKILNYQVASFLYAMFVTHLPIAKVKEIIKQLRKSNLYPSGFTYKKRANLFLFVANIYPIFLIICWFHFKFKN
jgi:glycosyltransferase involved in cell wall biosynthesis